MSAVDRPDFYPAFGVAIILLSFYGLRENKRITVGVPR